MKAPNLLDKILCAVITIKLAPRLSFGYPIHTNMFVYIYTNIHVFYACIK